MSSQPEAPLDADIAVVVLPSETVGTHVLDQVRRWYAAGLLRPALWVLPEDVVVGDTEAPRVEAHYLTETNESTGDLFELISRRRWRWVRLVLSQLLYRSDTVDEVQLTAAEDVRYWLGESLPGALMRTEDMGGTQLRAINLITGVTGLSAMPSILRPMQWHVHVVTSPEDRPTPERANVFVRSGGNLVPLSVLSTAVTAGLMPGQRTSPFDELEGDHSAVYGKAVVLRPTVRGLVATGVVEPIALRAAEIVSLEGGSTAVAEPERFVMGDRHRINDDLLEWLDHVDHGVLGLRSYDVGAEVGTETITVAEGAGEATRFVWRALVTLMWSAVHWLRRKAEDAATKAIVGEGSGVRLTLHADVSADLTEQVVDLESREIGRIRQEMHEIERRPPRMPTTSAWRDLTVLTHAVLDGGSLPMGAPEHLEGSRRMLLGSPHDVVVDPRDTFTVGADDVDGVRPRTLAAWSPVESEQLTSDLNDAERQLASALATARAEVDSLLANPPEDQEGRPAYDESLQDARSQLASSEAAVERCRTAQASFEVWRRRRVDGLLWRLGDRVVERRRRAAAIEQDARDQAVASAGLDPGVAGRLRARYLRRSWIAIGIAAAVLAFRWLFVEASPERQWTWTGGITLTAVLLVVAAALWWFRGVLRILYDYRRGALARARGMALFELAHGDRRRLEDVVRQLGQWVELLGWSLHTPWAAPDESEGTARPEGVITDDSDDAAGVVQPSDGQSGTGPAPDPMPAIAHLSLPACFTIGLPVIDDKDRGAVARQAAVWLAAQGWRTRAWRRLVGHHLSTHHPEDEEEIDRALDRLERDDGRGPADRERLLEDLRQGRPQRGALETVLAMTRDYLRETRLCGQDLFVQDMAGGETAVSSSDEVFLDAALVPASALAMETWSAQAKVRGGHEQLRTQCWTSARPAADHAASFERFDLDRSTLQQSTLLDVAVRVDVSHWRDAADLRVFGAPPENDQAYVFEGTEDDFV